ncbi:MAG: transglycosylase domain-containing protein [Deltaproteobacteria bacterium]|nr:transglycosylase domain-containing protein [Deltaproteobacteria bacterium]
MRYDAPPPRERVGSGGKRAGREAAPVRPVVDAWSFGDEPRSGGRARAHGRARGGRWPWLAAVAVALVVGGAFAAWLALPAIVRGRLQARLDELGLVGEVERVGVGLGGIHLENVTATLPSAREGLRVTLSRVDVDWRMVAGEGDAVVDGGAVRVDLGSRHLRAFVAKLRAREGGRARAHGGGGPRSTWRAGRIGLVARDAEGELLRASELAVERDETGAMRVALRGAELGRGVVRASKVVGARRDTGNVDVSVADATLRLTSSSDLGPVRALRRRILTAIDSVRPTTSAVAGRSPSASWRFGAREGRVLVGQRTLAEAVTLSAQSHPSGGIVVRATASAGAAPDAVDLDLTIDPERETARGNVHLEGLPLAVLAPALPDLPWHRPDNSFVRGQVAVSTSADGRSVEAEGSLTVTNLGFSSPRLGARPFAGLDLGLSGRATLEPGAGRVSLRDVAMQLGRVTVRASGNLRSSPSGWGAELDMRMPETRCADAFSAMPPAITEDLAGFSVDGTIGATIAVGIDSQNLDATRLEIDFRDRCRAMSGGYFADTTRFRTPFLHRVMEPDGVLREMTLGPGTPEWVPIDRISGFVLHAVLGREDAGFFRHRGFAPLEIRHALVRNLREGRYVYGASTITMQLVKNVFLRREKTLARKIQECLLTWYVEHVMEKGAILELYLNVIEFGPGVYGIGPAAQHYFGRRPDELSPAEAVFLATVLPNPRERHRMWEAGAVTPEWRELVRRVLRRLYRARRIDRPAYEHGMRDPIVFHRATDPPVAERDLSGLSWSRLPVGMASPVLTVVTAEGAGAAVAGDDGADVEGNVIAPADDEVETGSLDDGARARPRLQDGRGVRPRAPAAEDDGGWIEEDDTSVDATDE